MRSSIRITYADPGGVGNVVTGTEAKTSRTDFDIKRAVFIVDANATTSPATTDDHLFSVRRLNGQVTDLFLWTQVLPARDNVKPFLPKGIGTGTVQFIAEEIVAAAAGTTVFFTFDKPLIG